MNKVKEGAAWHPSVNDYAIHLMKQMNQNSDGTIDLDSLNEILRSNEVYLTDHELHTIYRKLHNQRVGKISVEEFYNALK